MGGSAKIPQVAGSCDCTCCAYDVCRDPLPVRQSIMYLIVTIINGYSF